MSVYSLSHTFLEKPYSADEQKIIGHHQAAVLLRVLGSAYKRTLPFDKLVQFICDHPVLTTQLQTTQDIKFVLRWHLKRLAQIGVIEEASS